MAREVREALPPFVFFLVLFHMIALTKAVVIEDFDFTALRAAGATMGALIVAKAILLVEALPFVSAISTTRIVQVLWKTALFSLVALTFRTLEEVVPLVVRHGGLVASTETIAAEVHWPLFGILALWVVGGLLLYCLAAELVREVGGNRVREILFGVTAREDKD
jgi:hypothetical protein